MKSTLNNACISALLCGAVFFALPALAAGIGVTAGGAVSTPSAAPVTGTANAAKAGTTADATVDRPTTANAGDHAVSTANETAAANGNTAIGGGTGAGGASADVNSQDLANSSANRSTQRTASHMSKRATLAANKAEADITRQLNQQQANVGGSVTVQQ